MKKKNGYTLVEVLVSMVLIMIVMIYLLKTIVVLVNKNTDLLVYEEYTVYEDNLLKDIYDDIDIAYDAEDFLGVENVPSENKVLFKDLNKFLQINKSNRTITYDGKIYELPDSVNFIEKNGSVYEVSSLKKDIHEYYVITIHLKVNKNEEDIKILYYNNKYYDYSYSIAYDLKGGYVGEKCANENGTCSFSGEKQICYGSGSSYVCKVLTDSTPCNNDIFTDPIPAEVKSCYVSPNQTKYKQGNSEILITNPQRGGYKFIGWTGSNNVSSGLDNYIMSDPYIANSRDHVLGDEFDVSPGTIYRVFVTAKRTKGSLNMQGGIWYTSKTSGTTYEGYQGEFILAETLSDGYARYYKDVLVPSGKEKGKFYIQLNQTDQTPSRERTIWNLADMEISISPTNISIPSNSEGNKTFTANWAPNKMTINVYAGGAEKNSGNALTSQLLRTSTYDYNCTDFSVNGLWNYDGTGTWTLTKEGYSATKYWHVDNVTSDTKIHQDTAYATNQALAKAMGKKAEFENDDINVNIYAGWGINNYYVDVNGLLDGETFETINGYGTFDVYINGVKVKDDVNDYYEPHPYGTTYRIDDIKAASNKYYDGVASGNLTGTIPASNVSTKLKFLSKYTVTLNGNGATTNANPSNVIALYSKGTRLYKDNNLNENDTITLPTKQVTVTYSNTVGATLDYTNATIKTSGGSTSYTLNGWYTSASGGSKVANSSNKPALQASVSGYTNSSSQWIKKSNETLYAQWSTTITLPKISKTGHTCKWVTDGGERPSGGTWTFSSIASRTFTVSCTPYKVKVKYHMNGGSWAGSTNSTLGVSGQFITKNGNTIIDTYNYGQTGIDLANYNNSEYINISKTGYQGKSNAEWNKNTSGTSTSFNQNAATTRANDLCDASNGDCEVTLYVNWEPIKYTITYHGNGNTDGKTDWSETVSYNSNYVTWPNWYTRSNYAFIGWNEKADGTGTDWTDYINSGWTWTYTKNVDLYAQWEPQNYTITYHGNGNTDGQGNWTESVAYNQEYITWDNWYTRSGYTFAGWNENASGTGISWTDYINIPWTWTYTRNVDLYAQWKQENSGCSCGSWSGGSSTTYRTVTDSSCTGTTYQSNSRGCRTVKIVGTGEMSSTGSGKWSCRAIRYTRSCN